MYSRYLVSSGRIWRLQMGGGPVKNAPKTRTALLKSLEPLIQSFLNHWVFYTHQANWLRSAV